MTYQEIKHRLAKCEFSLKCIADGTYKKNLNSQIIKKLGWKPRINLKNGLKEVILKQFNT